MDIDRYCSLDHVTEKNTLTIFVFVILSFSIGTATLKYLPEGYIERIESVFAEEDELDKSAASRPHFWNVALDMVKVYPFGLGPGCYPSCYNLFDISNGYYGRNRSVHSSHFQILADSGYLGLVIWVLIFIVSFSKLWKIRKLLKSDVMDKPKCQFYTDLVNMLLCSQTVFLVGGSFYEYAYNDITWLTLALVIVVDKNIKKEIENNSRKRMFIDTSNLNP